MEQNTEQSKDQSWRVKESKTKKEGERDRKKQKETVINMQGGIERKPDLVSCAGPVPDSCRHARCHRLRFSFISSPPFSSNQLCETRASFQWFESIIKTKTQHIQGTYIHPNIIT